MNKKILAVAVAGALAAPGLAMAQAATVSIYGLLDVRLDSMRLSGDTAGTRSSMTKSHMSGGQPNYVGFRGSEDLGNGLSAFFQVETQFFPDARQDQGAQQVSNATLGGRPTYLGLRSTGWGEITAGYQDAIYKDVQRATWAVAGGTTHAGIIMGNGNTTGSVPSSQCTPLQTAGTNVTAPTGSTICTEAPGSATSFNRTISNSIHYRTPTMSGFRGAIEMTVNEFKQGQITTGAGVPVSPAAGVGSQNPRLQAYSLTWSGGPFAAAAAYEIHNGFRATAQGAANNTITAAQFLAGTTTAVTNSVTAGVTTSNLDAKDTGFTIGGQWNYGKGKIGLGYERLKYGQVLAGGDGFTLPSWALEGTFNLTGSDTLFAAFTKTSGKKDCGALLTAPAVPPAGNACGSDTGAKMLSFGIQHDLSKRTALYAYYSKIDNNASANYNYPSDSRTTNAPGTLAGTNGTAAGLGAGEDSTSYNIGVKHTF